MLLLFAFAGQAWAQTSPRFKIHNNTDYIIGYQVIYGSDLPMLGNISFSGKIKLLSYYGDTSVFRSIGDYDGHVISVKAGPVTSAPDGVLRFSGEVASSSVPLTGDTIESLSLSIYTTGSGSSVHPVFGLPVAVPDDTIVGQNPPEPPPLRRHRYMIYNRSPFPTNYAYTFADGTQGQAVLPAHQIALFYGLIATMVATPATDGYNYTTRIQGNTTLTTNQVPIFETLTYQNYTEPGYPTGYVAIFTDPIPIRLDAYSPPGSSTGSNGN